MNGSFEPVLPKEENNINKEETMEDSEAVNAQTTDKSETVTKPTANPITNSSTTSTSTSNHDYDYDSDSEGELELHPILRANTNITKTKPDSNTKTDSNNSVLNPDTLQLNTKFKNRTFRNIAYTINSAPSVTETNGTNNTQ